jgi:hypothetical protein
MPEFRSIRTIHCRPLQQRYTLKKNIPRFIGRFFSPGGSLNAGGFIIFPKQNYCWRSGAHGLYPSTRYNSVTLSKKMVKNLSAVFLLLRAEEKWRTRRELNRSLPSIHPSLACADPSADPPFTRYPRPSAARNPDRRPRAASPSPASCRAASGSGSGCCKSRFPGLSQHVYS